MKYAVIQTGGKQYKVSEGDTIQIERLTGKPLEPMVFSDVLLSVMDGDVKIGKPFVSEVQVTADVLAHIRGEKIRVSKFKAKSRYRRTTGHRQELTQVKITHIGDINKKVPVKKAEKAILPKETVKKVK